MRTEKKMRTDEEKVKALFDGWGESDDPSDSLVARFVDMLRDVRAEEREACARECEAEGRARLPHMDAVANVAAECARRIRERGGA